MERVGAMAGAGALGSLAGCTGTGTDSGDGGSGDGGGDSPTPMPGEGEDGSTQTATETPSDDGSEGGSQETVTIQYLGFLPAENSATSEWFDESMGIFEDMHSNIQVNLSSISGNDLKQKLPSTVGGGNAPDLAESGTLGLQFFLDGEVADHGAYMEEMENSDGFTQANLDSMTYRGEFWSGGGNRHLVSMLGIRPDLFREAGVSDPSGLETWTDFRRALESIGESNPDIYPFEVTGVGGDLESYWGEARTAFTDGTDPWFEGSGEDATPKIGENPRTDGMIKNNVRLANEYSSPESASRGDEEVPAMLLTGRTAAFTYGLGSPIRYRSVKEDVTFGWDGEIWQGPIPRLDPNYGDEFGPSELAGKEGEHGGHLWSLEFQKQAFAQDHNNTEEAFTLMTYLNTSEKHNVPLLSQHYPAIASFGPVNQAILDEVGDDMPQIQRAMYEVVEEYGAQYNTTGAAWDLPQTSQIRWTDINETMSQAIAGQHEVGELPGIIRSRIDETMSG